jgi:hypothetical protein
VEESTGMGQELIRTNTRLGVERLLEE